MNGVMFPARLGWIPPHQISLVRVIAGRTAPEDGNLLSYLAHQFSNHLWQEGVSMAVYW